jgi:ABC-type sulfate transport system permease component
LLSKSIEGEGASFTRPFTKTTVLCATVAIFIAAALGTFLAFVLSPGRAFVGTIDFFGNRD